MFRVAECDECLSLDRKKTYRLERGGAQELRVGSSREAIAVAVGGEDASAEERDETIKLNNYFHNDK